VGKSGGLALTANEQDCAEQFTCGSRQLEKGVRRKASVVGVQYHEGRKSSGRPIHTRPLRLGGDTAVNKTSTTLNIPAPARSESPRQAQWKESTRPCFPIYLALAKQLEIEIPVYPGKAQPP